MTPPTPISRDELELMILDDIIECVQDAQYEGGWRLDHKLTASKIAARFDSYVAQEVAKARIDELEMAILMKGKSLVGDSIMDTSNLEGGHPNMIVASILDARLASLLDKKAAPLPKAKEES